ncbi:MAG TPA: hypothetical protein VGJ48_22190 [Pyrinomonadaceae bacterium]
MSLIESTVVYWVSDDIYDNSNPIHALLGINLAVCMAPLSWLIAAVLANSAQRESVRK